LHSEQSHLAGQAVHESVPADAIDPGRDIEGTR
jgi:hypothetical protein